MTNAASRSSLTVLIIGGGAMGSAMAAAWHNKHHLSIIDPHQSHTFKSAAELPAAYQPDVIIIAVKPQHVGDVIKTYVSHFSTPCLWVSVAAGISIETLQSHLSDHHTLVRAMPNLPIQYHQGMTCLFSPQGKNARADQLFSDAGKVLWLSTEDDMNKATAVAGSGPAYVYLLAQVLEKAAISIGLSQNFSEVMARQTLIGAAMHLAHTPENASYLKERVTSPNGTTAAARAILEPSFQELMTNAVKAAYKRAQEISCQS